MGLDAEQVHKPVRKIRKLLKKILKTQLRSRYISFGPTHAGCRRRSLRFRWI